MRYKKLLIFLILCIIALSSALMTFAILSKDNKNTANNVLLNQNIEANNIYENNSVENNIDENIVEENTNQDDNTVENNEQSKNETNSVKEKGTISKSIEESEEGKEEEESKQDKEKAALELTKEEWGEDDTVYYTIDRGVNNVYDISVRSKATTQTLAEYEVDIVNKTIQIK